MECFDEGYEVGRKAKVLKGLKEEDTVSGIIGLFEVEKEQVAWFRCGVAEFQGI